MVERVRALPPAGHRIDEGVRDQVWGVGDARQEIVVARRGHLLDHRADAFPETAHERHRGRQRARGGRQHTAPADEEIGARGGHRGLLAAGDRMGADHGPTAPSRLEVPHHLRLHAAHVGEDGRGRRVRTQGARQLGAAAHGDGQHDHSRPGGGLRKRGGDAVDHPALECELQISRAAAEADHLADQSCAPRRQRERAADQADADDAQALDHPIHPARTAPRASMKRWFSSASPTVTRRYSGNP
jgi:hypothetical protein